MTRKDFLTVGASALAPPRLPADIQAARTPARPKNVLFLLSDQHRPRTMGCAGDAVAHTPNLDTLARSGIRFDSAYCTNPVCTPSRASILTGLYTHNHRAWANSTPWPIEHRTMAHHFSRAGYVTGLIGKMHFVDAQTHGFDYRMDFNDWFQYLGPKVGLYAEELNRPNSGAGMPQIDDLWRDFGDPWTGTRAPDGRKALVHVGRVSKIPERDHFESFVARESVRFLKNFGRKNPFLLISSFLKPHDPYMPAQRFADRYPASAMRLPATNGKVDLSTVPKEIRDRILTPTATPELAAPELGKQRMAMYYANLAQMDDCIGQVLAALRELDMEKDTVVLYSSDHGEMLGEHGLWQKFVFYDPSVGVPLLFRVPGVTAPGARCATPASLVQLVSTLLELCGIPVPSGLDGDSLVPCLREPQKTLDRTVYAEHNLHNAKLARFMIRRGDFKYSHYTDDMPELYDLRRDPEEMKNLALLPAHKDKAAEMKEEIFRWYKPPARA